MLVEPRLRFLYGIDSGGNFAWGSEGKSDGGDGGGGGAFTNEHSTFVLEVDETLDADGERDSILVCVIGVSVDVDVAEADEM